MLFNFLDELVTNRITKKYLDLAINEAEYEENSIPSDRKRRRQNPKNKHSTVEISNLEDSPMTIDKLLMDNQEMSENGKKVMETKSFEATNQAKEDAMHEMEIFEDETMAPKNIRQEVVRYVEIPSSFPHFPRLTELYKSDPTMSKMWDKNHARLPIEENKVKFDEKIIGNFYNRPSVYSKIIF